MRVLRYALLVLAASGAGCSHDGLPAVPSSVDGADPPADLAMAPPAVDAAGWPRRITLQGDIAATPDQLRFADGVVVTDGADLQFTMGRVMVLRSPAMDGVCLKGVYPSLDAIPAETADCPAARSGGWEPGGEFSATSLHTMADATTRGLSMLVRDAARTTLYRLRILSHSYDKDGHGTVTFDYQPVW